MGRKYEKVKVLLPVVQRLQGEGKTRKEIARELGLQSERVVKDLLYHARHKQEKAIPKQRGRKPAKTAGTQLPHLRVSANVAMAETPKYFLQSQNRAADHEEI